MLAPVYVPLLAPVKATRWRSGCLLLLQAFFGSSTAHDEYAIWAASCYGDAKDLLEEAQLCSTLGEWGAQVVYLLR